MSDLEGMFKGVTRKTATATVCLLGDLAGEFGKLERELQAARVRDEQSFDGGEARKVVARMEAIREQMTAAEVTMEFVSMPPMRPMGLLAEHPPRQDARADVGLGYNEETYYPALIRESCAKVTSHEGASVCTRLHCEDDCGLVSTHGGISDEAWTSMLTGLGHKDFDQLVGAALEANGRTSVPFSHLALAISTRSEDDSKPPKRGTPRRSGSTGGSRKSSRSSPTTTLEGSSVP